MHVILSLHVDHPQYETLKELLQTLSQSHDIDIIVRKDGRDVLLEGDWLKGATLRVVEIALGDQVAG